MFLQNNALKDSLIQDSSSFRCTIDLDAEQLYQ